MAPMSLPFCKIGLPLIPCTIPPVFSISSRSVTVSEKLLFPRAVDLVDVDFVFSRSYAIKRTPNRGFSRMNIVCFSYLDKRLGNKLVRYFAETAVNSADGIFSEHSRLFRSKESLQLARSSGFSLCYARYLHVNHSSSLHFKKLLPSPCRRYRVRVRRILRCLERYTSQYRCLLLCRESTFPVFFFPSDVLVDGSSFAFLTSFPRMYVTSTAPSACSISLSSSPDDLTSLPFIPVIISFTRSPASYAGFFMPSAVSISVNPTITMPSE